MNAPRAMSQRLMPRIRGRWPDLKRIVMGVRWEGDSSAKMFQFFFFLLLENYACIGFFFLFFQYGAYGNTYVPSQPYSMTIDRLPISYLMKRKEEQVRNNSAHVLHFDLEMGNTYELGSSPVSVLSRPYLLSSVDITAGRSPPTVKPCKQNGRFKLNMHLNDQYSCVPV